MYSTTETSHSVGRQDFTRQPNRETSQTLLRGGRLSSARFIGAMMLFIAGSMLALNAQTYDVKGDFTATAKGPTAASLVEGVDGNFYVTTFLGGAHNKGSILQITPAGKIKILYSFCSLANCADGEQPFTGLTLGNDGNLYGVTAYGGSGSCSVQTNGCGTVFKVTLSGSLTTLHNFSDTDGRDPQGPLFLAGNGSFYGTTTLGGTNDSGTVYKMTPGGTLTTLYSFCSLANCADGLWPYTGLVQGNDGNFYGTTGGSDTYGGTAFKMTPTGTLTTLFTFCNDVNFDCTDGSDPSGLILAGNGLFYGTTFNGGPVGGGIVFSMTSGGTLTVLHTFENTGTDGMQPKDSLVLGTDGNLYGTTQLGGLTSAGTLFEITPSGSLTTLYSLYCEPELCLDGSTPNSSLIQGTDGTFYSTASQGGKTGYGTFFNLTTGLAPFVKTLPAMGKVGTSVTIIGSELTGATSVSFNGTAATFTVVSASEIKTKVPTGAKTGKIKVVTPAGTFTSNVVFRVPQ